MTLFGKYNESHADPFEKYRSIWKVLASRNHALSYYTHQYYKVALLE